MAAVADLGRQGAFSAVADTTRVPLANVCRWYHQREMLRMQALADRGSKGRSNRANISYSLHRGPKAKFELAEQVVIAKLERARDHGVRVGPTLVRTWMRRAVRERYGNLAADAFKASNTWLQGFLGRHDLRQRRATNNKDVSVEERLPKVQRWHKRFQRHVSQGEEEDPTFGRYKPANIMNSDQVPLCISDMLNVTYDKKGKSAVRIAVQKASEKRLATLQISVSLDGSKQRPQSQCKPTLIFKGKGHVTEAERSQYDDRVTVLFQDKAWMDGPTFVRWVEGPLAEHVATLPPGKKIMILDNLRAQVTDSSGEALRRIGVERRLLPAGVTDIIQPIDQNVGVDVKRKMVNILNHRLAEDEQFLKRWLGHKDVAPFTAMDRRILLTKILGDAWTQFCAAKDFRQLGLQTSCLMPKLGVERAAHGLETINIKGIDNYQFHDVELDEDRESETDTDADQGGADAEAADIDDSMDPNPAPAPLPGGVASAPIALATSAAAPKVVRQPKPQRDSSQHEITTMPGIEFTDAELNSPDEGEYIEADPDASDATLDDTIATNSIALPPDAPAGFTFEAAPASLPPIIEWKNRLVFWHARTPEGASQGWIKVRIEGGPNDPREPCKG
jgi:hypothetical protein